MRKSKVWSLSSPPPLGLQSRGYRTAEQDLVMTKPPFQNVLLLLYFMLHMMMWGEQMCRAGLDGVVEEDKAKGHPAGREEERGRWSVEQFPPFIRNLAVMRSRPSLWPLAA